MKKLILVLAMVVTGSLLQAQLVEKEGLYYDFNDNLYTGTYIEYFPNGHVRLEMNVLEGEKHGMTTYFFGDGTKKEVRHFSHNKMHGTWITWNEAGMKIAEARYNNGKKHGKWFIWDEDGTLRYEMEYADGSKIGVWKIWSDDGELVSQREF
jgi:antitoxin component YwqK of YwqJK toxin-antitoxin module